MVDGDFANFRAVYDELTDEVDRARYQFLPDHIANWFRTLDTTPRISAIVRRLEAGVEYRPWRHELARAVNKQRIEWPSDPEQALGIKLQLFRNFTVGGPDDIGTFGFSFLRRGQNINDNAHSVVEQIFMPMARELRRYFEQEVSKVPAADRVVPLNHNEAPYKEAIDALERLEKVLREANDYPDVADKEQRIAEVSATKRLLQSAKVRIGAVVSVAGGTLVYLCHHFIDTVIETASQGAIDKLSALLGPYF